jgi:hypothetical protein
MRDSAFSYFYFANPAAAQTRVYAGHAGLEGLHDEIMLTTATNTINNNDFFMLLMRFKVISFKLLNAKLSILVYFLKLFFH